MILWLKLFRPGLAIRVQLLVYFIITLVIMFALAGYWYYAERQFFSYRDQLYQQNNQLNGRLSQLRLAVAEERIAWNEVLLRGGVRADYHDLLSHYYKTERVSSKILADIRKALGEVETLLKAHDELAREHLDMMKLRRSALKKFNESTTDAYVLADQMSRPYEHFLPEAINNFQSALSDEITARQSQISEKEQKQTRYIGILVGGLGLFLIVGFIILLDRRVGRPAQHAVDLADLSTQAESIAQFGLWVWQPQGNDLFCSGGMLDLLAIDTHTSLTVRQALRHIHSEDRMPFMQRLAWQIPADGVMESEIRVLRNDGQIRHFRVYFQTRESLDGTGLKRSGVVLDVTPQHQQKAELQASEERLAVTLNSVGDALIATDCDGVVTLMNPVAERMTGWPLSEARGRHLSEVFVIRNALTNEQAVIPVEQVLDEGIIVGLANHTVLDARDGASYHIADSAAPIRNRQGEMKGVVMVFQDVTERMQTTRKMQLESALRRNIIDSLPGIFILYDQDLKPVMWNTYVSQMLGITSDTFIETGLRQYVVDQDVSKLERVFENALENRQVEENVDLVTVDDYVRSFILTVVPFDHEGQVRIIVHGIDVTDRRRAETQIEHMAYHDQLTGLPNRTLFMDRLGQSLAANRRSKRYGAVMFVDLDHFKRINDIYGHEIGDAVICDVVKRLTYVLRQEDTVARFGGDEFVVLLPELAATMENAASLALSVGEKLRATLETPAYIDEQSYLTTASIGVSMFPKRRENINDLVREADIAMYRAKAEGRNHLVFFEHDMQTTITERFVLEQDLGSAIEQGGFELYIQSQVDANGALTGCEALVRWNHATRGLITPASFIPLAEETGQVVAIGEWALREACKLINQLNAKSIGLNVAVNVSPRQFHHGGFVNRVKEILFDTGADPVYLTLEITENLLVERTGEIVSRMLELSELGISFSIDDFGTGYSSLAYLKRLPLNELKIDKSFVQDIPHDANDVALVETIVSMSQHLGFEVVAEGVETEEQKDFLTKLGCKNFQGYMFHRPQPVREWLDNLSK